MLYIDIRQSTQTWGSCIIKGNYHKFKFSNPILHTIILQTYLVSAGMDAKAH